MAITQARRRRAGVAIAAVGAVAFIAVGGGLAAGTLGSNEQPSPIAPPSVPSSESPSVQDGAEESPASLEAFGTELDEIFVQVTGWAISDPFPDDYDYAFNGPCSRNWGKGATSGYDGGAPAPGPVGTPVLPIGMGGYGFSSEAEASDAAGTFVESLESCAATAWRTQPIAQTGAVLAFSATGAAWIQQVGTHVDVLQVPTTEGPPPRGVQVDVAEWMVAYRTSKEQD
jgi:hypothetical protein